MGMFWRIVLTAVVATVVVANGDLSSQSTWPDLTDQLTDPGDGLLVPSGFEWFGPAVRERFSNRKTADDDAVDCYKVDKPPMPTQIPKWADATVAEIRRGGFTELTYRGDLTEAFLNGDQIVLKRCSRRALEASAKAALPNKSTANPRKDVYFACGDAKKTYTITLTHTLNFGSKGRKTRGRHRLIALDKNVILDGDDRVRIMRIRRRANVLVYGLTFRNGHTGNNYGVNIDKMPDVGYGGAAILATIESAITAIDCTFKDNKVESAYARWGGGAAIKLDFGAYGQVFGCDFLDNDAAVGGAIATSSAVVLYIKDSRFLRNVARGGMDDNGETRPDHKFKNPKKIKRVILVRGGALRIDSAFGSDNLSDEHVLICSSEFTGNKIWFKKDDLVKKYGYKANDWFFVRGAGATAALWNAPFNMDEKTDNHHFASVKNCTFNGNFEQIERNGDYLGRYVFEYMGAGHFKMEHCKFKDNRVKDAVLKVDNSERWMNTVVEYDSVMKDLKFVTNGGAYNIELQPAKHKSSCTFEGVDGVPDGTGNCRKQIEKALGKGGNVSIGEEEDMERSDPQASPTAAPTAAPSATTDPMATQNPATTATPTPVASATQTPDASASQSPDASALQSPDASASKSPDPSASQSPDPSASQSPNASASQSPDASVTQTPVPTPTLVPTPAPSSHPDFKLCKNKIGYNQCEDLSMRGQCSRKDVQNKCVLSCGLCKVCVDRSPQLCDTIARLGRCDDKAYKENCPLSCQACTPTATPAPTLVPTNAADESPLPSGSTATPTPSESSGSPASTSTPIPTAAPTSHPEFAACQNKLEYKQCENLRRKGKCNKPNVVEDCAMSCGMCEVCMDSNPQACEEGARSGQCHRKLYRESCPYSCQRCSEYPTPGTPDPSTTPATPTAGTPTTTPTPTAGTPTAAPTLHPDFKACRNKIGFSKCEDLNMRGQCSRKDVQSKCVLSCGLCKVCVDSYPRECEDIARLGRCDNKTFMEKCPRSCTGCVPPEPTPTLTPTPDATQTPLPTGGAKPSPSPSPTSSPSPSPSPSASTALPTPAPTSHPDFVPCRNQGAFAECEDLKSRGKCSAVSVQKSCAMSCGLCKVCIDSNPQACKEGARKGRCDSRLFMESCPLSCAGCLEAPASPTATPATPTATPATPTPAR